MSVAALIRRMGEAGASVEAIALAVEAVEAAGAEIAEARAKARDRKRAQRERDRGVTVTGQSQDTTPAPSLSPQTPLTHPHPRKGGSIARIREADDFEAFWRAYPAKIGKKAALAAWDKARDRPPLDEVLAAIDRYRRAKPPDRDWCHPSTWLNQGRWADEPPPPSEPGPRNAPANDHHPSNRPSAFTERLRAIDDAMAAAVGAGSG